MRTGAGALRVLVIAPTPFFGDRGCHVRIYEEVRGLAARGIETCVVTYPTGRDIAGVAITRARAWLGADAGALGPSWGRPILDLSLLATGRRVLRDFRPHVLHAHLHEGIAIGSVLRGLYGTPLVADLQGSLVAELADHRFLVEGGVLARAVAGIERWLARRPDRIVASSRHGVTLLVAQGVGPDAIEALPDGVDVDVFYPQPADPALVRALQLEGKLVIVFLGVLTVYQGVDLLLDAVPQVIRNRPDAHFLVMGYPSETHYRNMVRARGIGHAVTLPGRIPYDEAPRWLNLGDVAVSPKLSLTEANGKLLNYMACGLPVVASDTPVNRELLGEDGIYAAAGDAQALAARLTELLGRPDRSAAARGRATEACHGGVRVAGAHRAPRSTVPLGERGLTVPVRFRPPGSGARRRQRLQVHVEHADAQLPRIRGAGVLLGRHEGLIDEQLQPHDVTAGGVRLHRGAPAAINRRPRQDPPRPAERRLLGRGFRIVFGALLVEREPCRYVDAVRWPTGELGRDIEGDVSCSAVPAWRQRVRGNPNPTTLGLVFQIWVRLAEQGQFLVDSFLHRAHPRLNRILFEKPIPGFRCTTSLGASARSLLSASIKSTPSDGSQPPSAMICSVVMVDSYQGFSAPSMSRKYFGSCSPSGGRGFLGCSSAVAVAATGFPFILLSPWVPGIGLP